ncbi:MAG: hypothetical protein HC799_19460 [Limnothrix sp. RL_2_0]|nr:hypothetical protein [Limnothrix sp. RL_2_0]
MQLTACSKNSEKSQNLPSTTLVFSKEYKSLRHPIFSSYDVLIEYSSPTEFASKTSNLENIVILSSKHILIVNPEFSGTLDLNKLKLPKVSDNKIRAIWTKRETPTDASSIAVSESLDKIASGSEYRKLYDLAAKKNGMIIMVFLFYYRLISLNPI